MTKGQTGMTWKRGERDRQNPAFIRVKKRERERANPSFPRIQKSGNDADDDDDDDDIANSVIFMNHSL